MSIETGEQKSTQTETNIQGYVAKLHNDCGHPGPEKMIDALMRMIDALMREGCSDYSLGIATDNLTLKESVVEPHTQTWV